MEERTEHRRDRERKKDIERNRRRDRGEERQRGKQRGRDEGSRQTAGINAKRQTEVGKKREGNYIQCPFSRSYSRLALSWVCSCTLCLVQHAD
jgi:hypothetical protein